MTPRDFATTRHASQRYGKGPYTVHLQAVVQILLDRDVRDPDVLAAAWLHDVVEDGRATLREIAEHFGPRVADLVGRLSNGPGANRAERHALSYPRIRQRPDAVLVKLADRLANRRASARDSKDPRSRRFHTMYVEEHPSFREALFDPTHQGPIPNLWQQLETPCPLFIGSSWTCPPGWTPAQCSICGFVDGERHPKLLAAYDDYECPRCFLPFEGVEVVAGLITVEDRALLGRRMGPRHAGCWEFPGGKQEPGEDLPTALGREVWEELRLELVRPQPIAAWINRDYTPPYRITLFRATPHGVPTFGDSHTELAWMKSAQIRALPPEECTPSLHPLWSIVLRTATHSRGL